jgi:hypothetical protein
VSRGKHTHNAESERLRLPVHATMQDARLLGYRVALLTSTYLPKTSQCYDAWSDAVSSDGSSVFTQSENCDTASHGITLREKDAGSDAGSDASACRLSARNTNGSILSGATWQFAVNATHLLTPDAQHSANQSNKKNANQEQIHKNDFSTMENLSGTPPKTVLDMIAIAPATTPLPAPSMNQPTQSYECSVKSCPLGHHKERMCCYLPTCDIIIHWPCYIRQVLQLARKGTVALQHFLPGNENVAVCTRPINRR